MERLCKMFSAGSITNEADCYLNFGGHLWSKQIRHASILPDPFRSLFAALYQ